MTEKARESGQATDVAPAVTAEDIVKENEQREAEEKKAEEPEPKEIEEKTEEPTDDAGDKGAGDEGEPEEEPEPKKKRASGSERQKRKIVALEVENAELRGRLAADGAALHDAVVHDIGQPPKEEDFKGDYLAYERELQSYRTDYRITSRELKKEAKQAQEQVVSALREAVEDHHDRVEKFRKLVPDYDDTLSKVNLTAGPAVERAILESDASAHLVYHLAKNPRLLNGLNGMSDRQVVREIGRIEATLKAPEAKTKTEAKKPIAPLKGSASPVFDPYKSKNFDMDQYIKWREAGGK